jgi:glutamate/tyrosine decarboxylase-like PLP-dependent enzyme
MPSADDLRCLCARPHTHPDEAALRAAASQVLDWALHHHATLADQALGRPASRPHMEALLREPPPEGGTAFDRVLADFADKVAPYAVRVNHPRFFAVIPGAPSCVSVLGDWLCASANFFAAVWLEASGPTEVELVVLDWLRTFLGLPDSTRGILTGGGSEANLTALVVARERLAEADRGKAVLYLSEHRHWSVDRAARIIGLRSDQLRSLGADDSYRLQPRTLQEAVAADRAAGRIPWAVVLNAGTTNTGSVDPLAPLAEVCAAEELWLHVDAAYGWSAALTPEGRRLLEGIERADSVTLDPHKWLAQTFEVGAVLVRDGLLLPRTFSQRPDYMADVAPGEDEVSFADCGVALTRRFRALKLWLSIKVLGVGWFRELVRHCCRLADLAEALLREMPEFEVLSPRQLSIVCFRWRPHGRPEEHLDRLNLSLLDALRATGRGFLSSTRLAGRVALRLCFVNWRTQASDVEEVLGLLQSLSADVAADL